MGFCGVLIPSVQSDFLISLTLSKYLWLVLLLLQNYGVPEHWVTSRQVDLTTANSEVLPDIAIVTPEYLVNPESRLQNYVPNSPRSKIYVLGKLTNH